mmetsp:Transcript_17157/g.28690  ORF Transcript_17157/g.28690 Transcript_17157/m.28690 type:complete len:82 (+) Transcript_17157:3381-3626(+)
MLRLSSSSSPDVVSLLATLVFSPSIMYCVKSINQLLTIDNSFRQREPINQSINQHLFQNNAMTVEVYCILVNNQELLVCKN